ncbi:MAG: hypothetical protein QW524_02090 [Candidatus Woesearchaeota archaeon]
MGKKIKLNKKRTGEKEEKKENVIGKYLTLLLGLILVLSSFAFILHTNQEQSKLNYNNYNFRYDQRSRRFYTNVEGTEISTYYHPRDVDYLNLNFIRTPNLVVILKNFDEDEIDDIRNFVLTDLFNLYYLNINISIQDTEFCNDLTLVIDKNITERSMEKNCIYLPLSPQLLEVIDFIVFRYFNIIA